MKTTPLNHPWPLGLRWQSAAATPLFGLWFAVPKRRGASLPAAVQNLASLRLCAFAFLFLPLFLCAATNDLTSALQQGLFEEEANHNLEAAAQAYQAVSAQFDKDRKLAATAIFRLGEVYRKQGKTNEATAQYERIVREFSDQQTLAALSRQNLAGLGAMQPSNAVANDLKSERTGTANEGGQLAAQLSALERLEGDPEKQARAVYGMFPDEGLATMLQNLPLLKEQLAKLGPNPVSDGVKSWNFTVGPNGNSVGGFGNVSGFHPQKEIDGQLSLIAKRVDFILGVQKARLQVLQAAEPVSDRAAVEKSAPSTDEEEKEIRRIKALIQNSPDLINAGQNPPLFPAVEAGYLRVVRFLLDQGADVNAQPLGTTPLHSAAKRGQKAMTELLLSRGANVNARITVGNESSLARTPLHEAAQEGFQAVVEVLLANKADVTARDANGNTPLHLAARRNRAGVVATIAPKMPDINAESEYGITALGIAAAQGNLDTIKALLAAKAGVMAGQRDTPLLAAINYRKSAEVVELLLQNGADANAAGMFTPMPHAMGGSSTSAIDTPLHLAAERGQPETVKLLLQFKADPNILDASNRTPLSRAGVNTNVVQLLLEAKADPNLGDSESSLLQAVREESAMLAEMLLRAGADPNQETGCYLFNPVIPMPTPGVAFPGSSPPNTGATKRTFTRSGQWGKRTPLQAAALEDHPEMVRLLLQFKGDPNAKSPDGGYPLVANTLRDAGMLRAFLEAGADANAIDWSRRSILLAAAESGNVEAVKLLLAHGAEVNVRDEGKQTPLHLAVAHGWKEATEALVAGGADPNLRNKNDQTPLDFAKQTAGGPTGDIKALGNELATLLRKHGARDDLPKLDRIEVRRPAANYSATIFVRGNQDWNQFTLLELIAVEYGLLAVKREHTRYVYETNHFKPWQVKNERRLVTALHFPDFRNVIIRRPTADGLTRETMKVDLAAQLQSGECAKDVPLHWGDVVEITESDHQIDEQWTFPVEALKTLKECLSRNVTISVKDQTMSFTLAPFLTLEDGVLKQMLSNRQLGLLPVLEESKLLRNSSDLSRIKVTRRDTASGQTREWVVDRDITPDLWLRDGDVIEVPDKP